MHLKINFQNLTILRLIKLIKLTRTNSILRSLQYEKLSEIELKGKILDFGGGDKSQYSSILKGVNVYSINIDPLMDATWLIRPDDNFPNCGIKFETILSLNTLEHIFNPEKVLVDMFNALDCEGIVHISTPFLFQIHGHPRDFLRLCPDWYFEVSKRIGFRKCEINLLGLGKSSLISSLGLNFGRGWISKSYSLINDYFFYRLKFFIYFIKNKPIPNETRPIGLWVTLYK